MGNNIQKSITFKNLDEKNICYSTNKKDYIIINERKLWIHKSVKNNIFEKGNYLYIYTKLSVLKELIKIGETGSIGDYRCIKDRLCEQPGTSDTEPLLLLFVLDCRPYIEKCIIKNAKELEEGIHDYFYDKNHKGGAGREWFNISVDEVIKYIRIKLLDENIGRKIFIPHFLQNIVNNQILDMINKYESNIVADLCARFGKTLNFLELWNIFKDKYNIDTMILPSYMHSVFTSFNNEIIGKFKDENIGKWTNFNDIVIIDTRNNNWQEKFTTFYGKKRLLIFISCQTSIESYDKFELIRNIPSNRRFMLIDEADIGSHTLFSRNLINSLGKNKIKIITSGTGIKKAIKIIDDNIIDGVVSVSYTEMLLAKNGESKYMLSDYINEIDIIENKNLIYLLNNYDKKIAVESMQYVPDINFYKMIIPKNQKLKIESNNDKDLTCWSKILGDIKKNSPILKLAIQGLFGISGNSELDTLSIHNTIGKTPNVIHFFTSCTRNVELENLSNLFKTIMKNYIIRPLMGKTDEYESITNASSEEFVKMDIKKSKEEGKDGVIILSMNMGSRSFSVPEIDAVVLLIDNGSVSSLVQKISRALTGGVDYNGNKKILGNIISLSLDPNKIDNVDQFIIEECVKHKAKNESISSSIRRIRKSVNIFSFDDNGDIINLLQNDDYWIELINKYNFDDLKNSVINITPIINDIDFYSELLNVNSGGKQNKELKEKLLKGKGEKFINKKSKSSSNDDKSIDLSKIDLLKIKQSIISINNSILSIAAIDNSCFVSPSKRKQFKNIIKSIDLDNSKKEEFFDLLGIEPSIVMKLIDNEVINEEIIDLCLSKY